MATKTTHPHNIFGHIHTPHIASEKKDEDGKVVDISIIHRNLAARLFADASNKRTTWLEVGTVATPAIEAIYDRINHLSAQEVAKQCPDLVRGAADPLLIHQTLQSNRDFAAQFTKALKIREGVTKKADQPHQVDKFGQPVRTNVPAFSKLTPDSTFHNVLAFLGNAPSLLLEAMIYSNAGSLSSFSDIFIYDIKDAKKPWVKKFKAKSDNNLHIFEGIPANSVKDVPFGEILETIMEPLVKGKAEVSKARTTNSDIES